MPQFFLSTQLIFLLPFSVQLAHLQHPRFSCHLSQSDKCICISMLETYITTHSSIFLTLSGNCNRGQRLTQSNCETKDGISSIRVFCFVWRRGSLWFCQIMQLVSLTQEHDQGHNLVALEQSLAEGGNKNRCSHSWAD